MKYVILIFQSLVTCDYQIQSSIRCQPLYSLQHEYYQGGMTSISDTLDVVQNTPTVSDRYKMVIVIRFSIQGKR